MTETRPIKTANRWTKRSFLGIPLIAWAVMALAGTALAAGYFIVIIGATGSLSTVPGVEGLSLDSVTVADGSNCSASIVDGELDIQANGLAIGDYCGLDVTVANAGPVDAYFQGFQADYATSLGFATVAGDCGKLIAASADEGVTPGTNTVGIRAEVDSGTESGGTTFSPTGGDGLRFTTLEVMLAEDYCND